MLLTLLTNMLLILFLCIQEMLPGTQLTEKVGTKGISHTAMSFRVF